MSTYNSQDAERILRLTRCLIQNAIAELGRIRADVYDCEYLHEASALLDNALDLYKDGEYLASKALKFEIRESMKT